MNSLGKGVRHLGREFSSMGGLGIKSERA